MTGDRLQIGRKLVPRVLLGIVVGVIVLLVVVLTVFPPPESSKESPTPDNTPTPTAGIVLGATPSTTPAPSPTPAVSPSPTAESARPSAEEILEKVEAYQEAKALRDEESRRAARRIELREEARVSEERAAAPLMTEALEDLSQAEARLEDAEKDSSELERMATSAPDAGALVEAASNADQEADIREEEAGQHRSEFEAMRGAFETSAAPEVGYHGTIEVNGVEVRHQAAEAMTDIAAKAILSSSEGKAIRIFAVFYRGQQKTSCRMWVDLGCTYAFADMRNVDAGVYQVEGQLEEGAALTRWDALNFFDVFTARYHKLDSGEASDEFQRASSSLKGALVQLCPECTGHELMLFYSWEVFGIILSDARQLSAEVGLSFPEEVAEVRWLAHPEGAGYRIRVVELRSKAGERFSFE